MGQACRRAAGRIQSSSLDSSSKLKNASDRRQLPAVPVEKIEILKTGDNAGLSSEEDTPRINADNVLEERNSQYDAMLSQLSGRIKSKPGGKLEMGEASVVERYDRPMPKLRNTKPDSGRYEERPVPSGTLNVAQLRHIILLHQGKADDHDGPMDILHIAERFRIDTVQVQRILQFISLPPDDNRHASSTTSNPWNVLACWQLQTRPSNWCTNSRSILPHQKPIMHLPVGSFKQDLPIGVETQEAMFLTPLFRRKRLSRYLVYMRLKPVQIGFIHLPWSGSPTELQLLISSVGSLFLYINTFATNIAYTIVLITKF